MGPLWLLVASLVLVALAVVRGQPQAVLEMDAHMAQLAAEAATQGPATPIPLLGEGTRPLGAVYDQFLIGVLIARGRIAAGQPADAATIAADPNWRSRATVVVAYPIDCEGRPNHPTAIRWKGPEGLPVQPTPIGEPMRGAEGQKVLPGVGLPDDALVVMFRNALMIGARADVDYAEPVCHGGARTASLPVVESPSAALARGFNGLKLPSGLSTLPSPTTVRMRVLLDATGRARFPEQVQGPAELGPAANAVLTARTYPPATVNGVPMPRSLMVAFVFTATGEPATAAPYTPAPPPPGTFMTQSTVRTTVPAGPLRPPPVVPPAPAGQLEGQLARLAIEVAGRGDPVPIPFDAAGPAVHGVIFDRFLVGVVKARAAMAAGTPLDPASADLTFMRGDLIAVAYPIDCGGRTLAPKDVHIWVGGARPGLLPETGPPLSGAALEARLPGVPLPAAALARTFVNAGFSNGFEVRVSYAEPPCGGSGSTLSLPIQFVRGSFTQRLPAARMPPGASLPSPTTIQMRGLVDLDGAYRFPTVADGPQELTAIAVTTAAGWRMQPYRANGVPIPMSVIAPLMFTTSGMPEPPPPQGLAPPAPPSLTAATTVGGRSTEDFTTPDEAGLSAATSQCAIAGDATYGFTPTGAIKTGGGMARGPGRQKQYLALLRGPAGQGLHVVRRGSLPAPDGQAILDLYELTYAGLAAPVRLYLDEYHDGTLQAPQGLVCAAPIEIR